MRDGLGLILVLAALPAWAGLARAQPVDVSATADTRSTASGRELAFTLELPDTPAALYRKWIDASEARRFLAEEVRIEPRVGGRYETLFDPENDPAGALAGTYGSKIVALEPPSRLVFEWNSLTPRVAAREVGGRRVRQESLVEVRFEAVAGAPGRTRLHIRHYGMGEGPDWEASFRFYRERGWPWILDRLRKVYSLDGP